MKQNKVDNHDEKRRIIIRFIRLCCFFGCVAISVITLAVGDQEGKTNLFFSLFIVPAAFILAAAIGVEFTEGVFAKMKK